MRYVSSESKLAPLADQWLPVPLVDEEVNPKLELLELNPRLEELLEVSPNELVLICALEDEVVPRLDEDEELEDLELDELFELLDEGIITLEVLISNVLDEEGDDTLVVLALDTEVVLALDVDF